LEPGVSVVAVAMAGGVNANRLFRWHRKHLNGLAQRGGAVPWARNAASMEASNTAVRLRASSFFRVSNLKVALLRFNSGCGAH